jgi:DnaJ-domain-containing protein 1
VETLEDGRFSYYAGGFRSRAEAEKAVEVMKKKGFRNPQIVEWCDGYKTNLSEAGSVSFRLMISGGTLDDSVRNVIETMAPDCQLSRLAEDSFAVGMFSSRAMAERVAQAIVKSNEGLSVDVEELQAEEEEE